MRPGQIVFATLLLAGSGCGERLDASYSDASGITRYVFSADGSVVVRMAGSTHRARYRQHGDQVRISGSRGDVVLIRRSDRLTGPMGLVLDKDN